MIRQKLVALSTYGIYPATYGGPVRVLNLLRRMAQWYDVTVLSYDCHAKLPSHLALAAGLDAWTFPTSAADMRQLLYMLDRSRGLFLHDILCARDYTFGPDFLAVRRG